jgi:hypothetical protein
MRVGFLDDRQFRLVILDDASGDSLELPACANLHRTGSSARDEHLLPRRQRRSHLLRWNRIVAACGPRAAFVADTFSS